MKIHELITFLKNISSHNPIYFFHYQKNYKILTNIKTKQILSINYRDIYRYKMI